MMRLNLLFAQKNPARSKVRTPAAPMPPARRSSLLKLNGIHDKDKGIQTPWIQMPHLPSIWGMSSVPKSHKRKALSLRQTFARNVRLVRIHKGVSQERLANEADLDRAFVGTLERGQRNISIDNIELLAAALGVPAHELLDPALPEREGFDVTLMRAPRTSRHAAQKTTRQAAKRR
jgi:transcriptional regulator with XRE-family HTH domain